MVSYIVVTAVVSRSVVSYVVASAGGAVCCGECGLSAGGAACCGECFVE